jgi:hypothetical protein
MGKNVFYNICLSCNFFAFKWPNIHEHLKKYIVFSKVLYMSNNFPTFSRIFLKILSILVYIVLSMKFLGLDAIHFRI